MSILDSPFRFTILPTENLTKLPSHLIEGPERVTIEVAKRDAEHQLLNQYDSKITIDDDDVLDRHRLKHLVIRECARVTVNSVVAFGSAQFFGVEDSLIDFSAVKGSVSLTSCKNLTIRGFCGQLRLTDCSNLNIFVQTSSSTALVNSKDIRVYPPPDVSPGTPTEYCLKNLGMNEETYMKSTKWANVVDFDSLGNTAGNFSIHQVVLVEEPC